MNSRKTNTLQLAYAAIGAVFICICSWLVIPGPVPFTMQTWAVFLLLFTGGETFGMKSILTYIFLGMIGLPVFSGFQGGPGILLGLTGGYIAGFIAMGMVFMALVKVFGRKPVVEISAMTAGLLVCYAFGTLWFTVVSGQGGNPVSIGNALLLCVVPFIIPDFIKMALAYSISKKLRKHLNQG